MGTSLNIFLTWSSIYKMHGKKVLQRTISTNPSVKPKKNCATELGEDYKRNKSTICYSIGKNKRR